MFPAVLELQPGTRYLLSLSLAEEREDTVSTDQVEKYPGFVFMA